MKKLLIYLCVIGSGLISYGQSRYAKVPEKSIYVNMNTPKDKEDVKFKYFIVNEEDKEDVTNIKTFDLKQGYTNVYMNWLNPLQYQLKWSDTTVVDPRTESLKEFISLLTGQFGSPVTGLNKKNESANQPTENAGRSFEGDKIKEFKKRAQLTTSEGTKFYQPEEGFSSTKLMSLYFTIENGFDSLKSAEDDVKKLNELLKELKGLDTLNDSKIGENIKKAFNSLYNLEDPTRASSTADAIKFDDWEKRIQKMETSISLLKDRHLNNRLVSSDEFLNNYTVTIATEFVDEVKKKNENYKTLIAQLKTFKEQIKNSVKNKTSIDGYYYVKDFNLEEDKMILSELTVTKTELNFDDLEKNKSEKFGATKFTFRNYDPVDIFVSTGVAYASTTLKGFGVSTNDDGDLVVSADDIKANTPVTALFLNFQTLNHSRTIAPLLQLGVDPTKKRPFLLAGGGFSIARAKFALTGGAIWTWQADLDELSVGDVIESTTDLENDLTYTFKKWSPVGGYLGIQLNF
jgi:hypothetical protein